MYRSIEMRWFFDQPPFRREDVFGDASREEPRTDWYAPSRDDGCGIKIRGGKLETKLRTAQRGTQTIAGLRGRLEEWCKWRVELPSEDAIPVLVLESTGWTAVAKERYTRFFSLPEGPICETDEPGEEGCQVEWTELWMRGRTWWTVGFEAYGDASRLEAIFVAVAAHVVAIGLPSEPFREANSSGYPRWLNSQGRAAR